MTSAACTANVENGQAMRENVAEAMRTVLAELAYQASVTLGDETLEELWPALLERVGPAQALRQALARWCMADPRPLVLLIDEIDALIGDTLLSVLRQLRTGYVDRPRRFPHSIILCGLRDVRDYRIQSSAENRLVLGGSAFNIKSESLRLGDFSEQETRALTAQHTAQTGQAFTACAAVDLGTHQVGAHFPHGRHRNASRGWSTRCATTPASATSRGATVSARSPRPPSWRRRSG